ncbi:MAG: KpsF/GutQ family sugar-phosphate isomerase [Pyramidobacter sp.]|nr:KpsF/GutQ family sugar-phosphate isomerase [Pyramidobacter sp.]
MTTSVTLPSDRQPEKLSDEELLEAGREVLRHEAEELVRAASRFGMELVQAARIVEACKGRIVVSGIGKAGHVGRKVAATLSSLGTPSFFLQASEAAHGDLGMVRHEDVALLISHSGKTGEVVALLPFFRRIGAPVIAITGDANSPLALGADVFLDSSIEREADPLQLAPTSSTTLQLAVGDALGAMVTLLRGLKKEDFALFHPAGSLGKKLLLRVCDVMNTSGSLPVVSQETLVKDALFEITSKNYGATCVTDDDGLLVGIFTDGDLRRLIAKEGIGCLERRVGDVMIRSPRTINPDSLAAEAVHIMEKLEISVLVVIDKERRPVGMVHIHELLQSGVA